MAKTITRRPRQRKRARPPLTDDDYAPAIIRVLERVRRRAGRRPAEIFRDWRALVEASLTALPAQLRQIGRTGSPGPDTPKTAELFGRLRERYAPPDWRDFAEAFGLLLDSSAPGLQNRTGVTGPDVLGQVYMTWSNTDPSWRGQYFTPWPVARLMAELSVPDGAREVHDRLKRALLHPDNVWGQTVLLAEGLALPSDGAGARDYFFSTVLPAALPWYEKILVNEPAVGSGALLISLAGRFPAWANYWGLIEYTGQDLDEDCVRMTRIQTKLYGLNSYDSSPYIPRLKFVGYKGLN